MAAYLTPSLFAAGAVHQSPIGAAGVDSRSRQQAGLPAINELGRDLLKLSTTSRIVQASLPFLSFLMCAVAIEKSAWLWMVPAFLIHFVVSMAIAHELVHGFLGFNRRTTDTLLFLLSLLLLQSGHTFRRSHLLHHSECLSDNDVEGRAAMGSFLAAVLSGPTYIIDLWRWAYQDSKNPRERQWLMAEAVGAISAVVIALLLAPWHAAPLIYLAVVWLGSWTYPALTTWMVHHESTITPFGRAVTTRIPVLPYFVFNLIYHLEHHLYPQVPGSKLHLLATRLDPYFKARGMAGW